MVTCVFLEELSLWVWVEFSLPESESYQIAWGLEKTNTEGRKALAES